MNKALFKEEQNFSNIWLYVFVTIAFTFAIAPTVLSLYSQVVAGNSYGDKPTSTQGLLILLFLLLTMYAITLLLFNKMKLVTQITSKGLEYKYPPFILKFKTILKQDIERYKIRKYQPGGIGYSLGKAGRAYNVKGNIGLQLYLKDGKVILFGTQRGDAMLRAMNKLMKEDRRG